MISLLATLALAAATGFILGYAFGSKSEAPVKRTVEQLNDAEALRAKVRKSDAEASQARCACKQIINGLDGQQSGAAIKAVRLAKQGLGE